MNKYLLIIGTYLIRAFLCLFYVFPIKRNRVMFNSRAWRQYSCNPRYVTEYLLEHYPGKFEIIWAFRNPEEFSYLKEKGIKICKTRSIKFYYYSLTAKVSVTNATAAAEIPKRRGQYRINTWHGGGGGYKRIDYSGTIGFRPRFEVKETDLFCASSETSLKFTVREAFHHDGEYFRGTPRNDILVNGAGKVLKKTVYDFFHLDEDVHIALYAPTFREGSDLRHKSKSYDYGLDYLQLHESLTKKFGGKWIVAIRFHNKIREYKIPSSDKIIDATVYPDMQDLLAVVDVLLTDYSSSIWDFSFTYKPCFLFCNDLKEYEGKRGFNKPIRSWGFPIAETNDELTEKILNWNKEEFDKKMNAHHEENGSFEDGTATKRLCELLDKKCFG